MIINDISSSKRGHIGELSEENSRFGASSTNRTTIKAIVPLSETVGYSTFLRSISKVNILFLSFLNEIIKNDHREKQVSWWISNVLNLLEDKNKRKLFQVISDTTLSFYLNIWNQECSYSLARVFLFNIKSVLSRQ